MRAPAKRIIENDDVAGFKGIRAKCFGNGERHRAEMHGHVIPHGDGFGVAVVDGAREVETLFDVGGEGGAAQDDAHLLGNREEDVAEDFELEVESAHRVECMKKSGTVHGARLAVSPDKAVYAPRAWYSPHFFMSSAHGVWLRMRLPAASSRDVQPGAI